MTWQLPDPGFFVGYFKKMPASVRRFSLLFGVFFVAGLASAALALSLSTEHPGTAGYVNELGDNHLTGILETAPYPVLRVPASDGKPARAIMIAGQGKVGMQDPARSLAGKWVDAGGIFVKRGDLDMLLIGGKTGLRAADPVVERAADPGKPVPLGRWRLTGEICDGKCYAGSMRPGSGLAHKACAGLCISGGVPPVFVSTAPVDGDIYLLLAAEDGGPVTRELLDKIGTLVVLDGDIERRDDLLVFKVSTAPASADPS